MPGSKKQFGAIEYHTKSISKKEEYAEDEGIDTAKSKEIANEIPKENE